MSNTKKSEIIANIANNSISSLDIVKPKREKVKFSSLCKIKTNQIRTEQLNST